MEPKSNLLQAHVVCYVFHLIIFTVCSFIISHSVYCLSLVPSFILLSQRRVQNMLYKINFITIP